MASGLAITFTRSNCSRVSVTSLPVKLLNPSRTSANNSATILGQRAICLLFSDFELRGGLVVPSDRSRDRPGFVRPGDQLFSVGRDSPATLSGSFFTSVSAGTSISPPTSSLTVTCDVSPGRNSALSK